MSGPAEFSRPIPVAEIAPELRVADAATAQECAALTRRYNVPAVRSLSVDAAFEPWGPGGWRLTGLARAGLTQTCVVTLEPLDTEVEERIARHYAPPRRLAEAAALLADDDEPDPLEEAVDVGEAAAEAVALAIDPYPRTPGVAFEGLRRGPPGAEPLTDEAARPFAALAALRRRGGDDAG